MTNPVNPLPFEIKTSKFEGRYITSPIDSDAGKVCFDDKPLVHVTVSQEYCAFCLKRFARVGDKKDGKNTKNNIKCNSTAKGLLDFVSCVCGREFYCNIRCQVAAWREYHWLECYMYGCLKDTANDRLALRLLLKSARHGIPILGIKNPVILHSTYPTEKINHRFQKADSKIQTDSNPDSKPDSKTDSKSSIKYTPNPNFELDSLYLTQYLDNTPNPKVTAHPSARRLAALVAQAITCYCKNSGHAGDMINDYKLTREDFIFESCGIEEIHDFQNYKKTAFTVDRMKQITTRFDKNSALQVQLYEIFVKLLDMVHKNAVTISRNRVNHDKGQVDEDERHQIGLALYPRVSFLNHSCKPNAFLAFGNLGNVQVKITERIQSGDSINISYGPTAFRSNTRVRKEFLFQNYCFPCGCVACSPNSKLRKEFDDLLKKTVALKCEACLGFLGDKSQGLHVDGFYRCEHCDEKFLLKEKEVKVKEAKFLFEKAKINPGQRLECLEKSLGIAESVYFEMNEILIEIRDKLAHELARNTLFEKAAKYVQENYVRICPRYGKNSIEAANELIKLATLWTHIKGKENKGIMAVRNAQYLISIYEFDRSYRKIR